MTTAPSSSTQLSLEQRILELEAKLLETHRSRINLRLKEPDTFQGKSYEQVDRWIFQVEQYLRAAGEDNDSYKVAFAAALLRGTAQAWWETIVDKNKKMGKDESECTWTQFKDGLTKSFRTINHSDRARDQLVRLVQRTSVSEYANRFSALVFDIEDLQESEKIDRFFRGLKPAIRKELVLKGKPQTFDDLLKEAERVDSILFEVSSNSRRQPVERYQDKRNEPVPMELDVIAQPHNDSKANTFTKLTPELKQQLIKEGKCLYCRQPGHKAMECPAKIKKYPKVSRQ